MTEQTAADTTDTEGPQDVGTLSGDANEKGTQNVSTPGDDEGLHSLQTPGDDAEGEPDTFPRAYVEQLRKEAADARVKAKGADDLAQRLHVALVAATGRLADPTDLPFDAAHLDDADALTAAVDAILEAKPHLASRRVTGNIGQGATGASDDVSLAGILRAGAI